MQLTKIFRSLLIFLAQLDDIFGTGLHTGITCRAFIVGHNRKAGFGIHMDGIEVACPDTVTMSKTSVLAARIASSKGCWQWRMILHHHNY